jgi:ATP-dependent DNA helicase RecG
VFAQVRRDLARPSPMLRLVQGDVGSGKTVVAALAALAVEAGQQAALVAPTELLAEQHAASLRVAGAAGRAAGLAGRQGHRQGAQGNTGCHRAREAQVTVGTHA